jgi:hypothetical protein
MFLKGAIRSVKNGRKPAIFATTIVALLSVPVMLYSWGTIGNGLPMGHTGAPGQGTCASCHGTLTAGSGVTVNAPASYTAGGAAVSMTVTIPSTGGFELAILTQSGNAQAGTLVAGPTPVGASFPTDAETTVGSIQYVASTTETTSWTFGWTPPATDAGTVVLYVTGGTHGTNYSNSYTITSSGSGGGSGPVTLVAMPTSLSFTVNGAEPADQTISVTSSGSPIAVTASSATSPAGGTWLTIMPPGGNTPLTETVHIVATGLAANTYNGSVSFASTGATNSPVSVPVTLTVTTPIPTAAPPTLNLSSTGLTFNATIGSPVASQSVMVTTSTGSAVTLTAAASTTTGGSWLGVGSTTGTTPDSESVTVTLPSGIGAGTYHGTVMFSSSAVSNSPVSLPVTLNVTSSTPPPPPTTGTANFSAVVVDRQSGGNDWLLLDGSGSASSTTGSGSGFLTRFRSSTTRCGESGTCTPSTTTIVSNGTWKVTGVTSFTPITDSTGRITGGTLVLKVQITTAGSSTPSTGTLTITSTGSTGAGVTFGFTGGSTFGNAGGGIGTYSITSGGGGGCDDGCGGGGTPTPTPTPTPPPTTDN